MKYKNYTIANPEKDAFVIYKNDVDNKPCYAYYLHIAESLSDAQNFIDNLTIAIIDEREGHVQYLYIARNYLEKSQCYAVSLTTLNKYSGITLSDAKVYLNDYNIFQYDNVWYIGSEKSRLDYYQDKIDGTNPFFQTC